MESEFSTEEAMPAEKKRIQNYRDLVVWQKGMDLVVGCYRLAGKLPPTERYGLISQIQRAAVSIPANIAEGHIKRHTAEYVRHLSIAAGSLAELETHLEVAARLRFLSESDLGLALQQTAEIGRMLFGLIRKLQSKGALPRPQAPGPCCEEVSCLMQSRFIPFLISLRLF